MDTSRYLAETSVSIHLTSAIIPADNLQHKNRSNRQLCLRLLRKRKQGNLMPAPLKTRLLVLVCLLASLLSLPQQIRGDNQHPLISFQVPDSPATYPMSINEAATVTGYYISNSGVSSGFVRYQDGQIITFDVPGSTATIPSASTPPGTSPATTTSPARRLSSSTSRKASYAPPMERSPPSETP